MRSRTREGPEEAKLLLELRELSGPFQKSRIFRHGGEADSRLLLALPDVVVFLGFTADERNSSSPCPDLIVL